jgi:hypothetical protein
MAEDRRTAIQIGTSYFWHHAWVPSKSSATVDTDPLTSGQGHPAFPGGPLHRSVTRPGARLVDNLAFTI